MHASVDFYSERHERWLGREQQLLFRMSKSAEAVTTETGFFASTKNSFKFNGIKILRCYATLQFDYVVKASH